MSRSDSLPIKFAMSGCLSVRPCVTTDGLSLEVQLKFVETYQVWLKSNKMDEDL